MYKSCHLLQHGLCFFDGVISSCCFSPVDQINEQLPPILFKMIDGEQFSIEKMFERMENHNNVFKNGGCLKECENCYHLEEKKWTEEKYIDQITITNFSNCNANCIYCSNNKNFKLRTNDTYKILPILDELKEKNIIRENCELHIGGGEFTIYEECEEFLQKYAVTNFARVFVPTNSIIYSETLFQAMDKATTYIIVSLDCGSRNLYKKIKRTDKFDTVVKNLSKYAKTEKSQEAIRLKYIIIPTINDNVQEFKKFLKVAKKLQVKNIIIDIDARYARMNNFKIDDYFINLAKNFNNVAVAKGFNTEFYSFFFQCTQNKKIKTDNPVKQLVAKIKFKYFNKNLMQIKKLYEFEKQTYTT